MHVSDTVSERERHAIPDPEGSKPQGPATRGGLAVVATPIGNMGDIGERAIRTLRDADVVACEDTRVTGGLLKRLGLSVPMVQYHEHNAERMRPQLISRMKDGQRVALVSDAGTPLISDPGYKLVREAADEAIPVIAIPGPSALLAALAVAGLPTDRFLFAGFPPNKDKARREFYESLRAVPATLVFYESVHRLADSLAAMAETFGDREAAVCRELTKLHEEVRRAPLPALAARYAEEGPPKGEAVVVVGPPAPEQEETADEDLDALLRKALETRSLKDAAAEVAAATGLKRREVYARALEIQQENGA